MNFRSDNTAGVAEPILEAIVAANGGTAGAYGGDDLTAQAGRRFDEIFECETDIFFVGTGSAANAISLAACCPPWGIFYAHEEAHAYIEECNAAGFYTASARGEGLPGDGSLLDPKALEMLLARWPVGDDHFSQPAAVTVTQASESGQVMPLDQVAEISAIARRYGMKVHMDGARFANAVASLGASPAEITWKAGVDILSFGGSKNGALNAEAIVVFDRSLSPSIPYRRMRGGHTASKSRFVAAQFLAMLKDDLWLELAGHSNAMAQEVAKVIEPASGIRLAAPVTINEVFAFIGDETDARLRQAGIGYSDWWAPAPYADNPVREGEKLYRFVAAFLTTPEDVAALEKALRS